MARPTRTGTSHALAYRAHFAESLVGAVEDNVAVLRDLHAAGVPLFALTNWSAELFPQALDRFDFLALFDDIVVSGAEGVAEARPGGVRGAAGAGRPAARALRVRRRLRRQRRRGRRGGSGRDPVTTGRRCGLSCGSAACRSDGGRAAAAADRAARSTSSSETPCPLGLEGLLPPRIPNSRLVQRM